MQIGSRAAWPVCRKKITAWLKTVTNSLLKLLFPLREAQKAIRQTVAKTRQDACQSGLHAKGADIAWQESKGANSSQDAGIRGSSHDNQPIASPVGSCRQGLPLEADEAAEHWDKGQTFVLENGVHLARYVEALLRQCNWEVERSARAA